MNNLLAWWKMAGDVSDSSGNGNDGTNEGATLTTDRFGNANSAYSFDGSASYINVSSALPSSTSNFTLLAWVYPTSLEQGAADGGGGRGGTIFNADNDGDFDGYDLGINDSNKIWWWPAGNEDLFSTSSISLDTWTHIAVAISGSTATMYINGKLDSSQSSSSTQTPTFLQIGSACHITGFWEGKLSDLRIYDATLSANSVLQIYQQFDQASNFFSN